MPSKRICQGPACWSGGCQQRKVAMLLTKNRFPINNLTKIIKNQDIQKTVELRILYVL
jgi:hypothetical protein